MGVRGCERGGGGYNVPGSYGNKKKGASDVWRVLFPVILSREGV